MIKLADYYIPLPNNLVQCNLCPHNCIIKNGKSGNCNARHNVDGKLYASNYEKIIALNIDPIEKKPLYHFYPGSKILSVGTYGCNFKCVFCQNYNISQTKAIDNEKVIIYHPEELVYTALRQSNNIGIAYTYNEPSIWFEFLIDTAKIAQKYGLKNVMVTNGFINPEPLKELLPFIDAFNVDLKGFSNDFYLKNTTGSLEPVLETIKSIYESGKHIEITNLVVTGLNDDALTFKKMIKWIKDNTSPYTPLHISRYFPSHKYSAQSTSKKNIEDFIKIAREYLSFVYSGNIETDINNNTYCPKCSQTLIKRNRYYVEKQNITNDGKCAVCLEQIIVNQ